MRKMSSKVPVYRCKVSPTSRLQRPVSQSPSCPRPPANIPGTGTKVREMDQDLRKPCRYAERCYGRRLGLQTDSDAKMKNPYNDDGSVANSCFEARVTD